MEEMKDLIQNRDESITDSGFKATDNMEWDSMIRIPLDFDAYVKQRKTLKIVDYIGSNQAVALITPSICHHEAL